MSGHSHAHGHHHHHHVDPEAGDRKVMGAIAVNMLLTLAQVVGGILSGSLALIADALHNFSDAISLVIAVVARRIARRPSDESMTFGYVRAEVVAALVNYTTLVVIGLYLVYEAVMRFIDPEPVTGWLIVVIAGIALVVDLVTAFLTYAMSKDSMNIRAAFLHNVADALGSVGVIVAGTLILLFDWQVVDPIVTLLIAGYILWHVFSEIGESIRVLMLGTPPDVDMKALVGDLSQFDGVRDVHHVHVWAIDEKQNALEAHVVVPDSHLGAVEALKARLKERLRDTYGISHTTLEFEHAAEACEGHDAKTIGHPTGSDASAHHHDHSATGEGRA